MSLLYVINSNGEKEPFSFQKVYRSARRVGASRKLAEKIVGLLAREAYPGIKTSEIFRRVKELLHHETPAFALKFSLKEGMRKLGPTGFPFEQFVAAVLRRIGFEVVTNLSLNGFCLRGYEIDLVARQKDLVYVGECKYRRLAGESVHVDDVLANQSRFLDLIKGNFFKSAQYRGAKVKSLMVTNAKFTARAAQYAVCSGIDLLGWRWPLGHGLESLVDQYRLYPISILPSLGGRLSAILAENRIMLAKDLLEIDPLEFSRRQKVPIKILDALIGEAKELLLK